MKCPPSSMTFAAFVVIGVVVPQAGAQTMIFSDNFDIANTGSLDGSNQTGRRSGLMASDVVLRSGGIQHTITNGELNVLPSDEGYGRVRFQKAASLPANALFNFAEGAGGAQILADGGFSFEFDWTPPNNTSTDWVGLNVGFNYLDTTIGAVNPSTDFAVFFRNNGAVQIFDNGISVASAAFSVTSVVKRHGRIDFSFNSFADGTAVTANLFVDNQVVGAPVTFSWAGNSGVLNLEMASNSITKKVDNVAIKATSGVPNGDLDGDGILDEWELSFPPHNLTALNGFASGPGPGVGTGDFDDDGISDLEEYNYSQGQYHGISPVAADSDGDTLGDLEEIFGSGNRPATSPVRADTDFDGLNDLVESNSGTFGGATDSGSDPTLPDTDSDGSRDDFEIAKGSNPVDSFSRPALPVGFALVPLTDDASTGLDPSKTYTHLVSGAQAASVNGVDFTEVNLLTSPPGFEWSETGAGVKDAIVNNNNTWAPSSGGVTGPGLLNLLDSFIYTTGGSPGQYQTYTLSGLTPGTVYQVKLYIRSWDRFGGSGRPLDLTFTNGASVEMPFGGLKEDRPGTVLNNGNDDSAYYLSYTYVAQSQDLVIRAAVHASSVDTPSSASGNFHLYALSNEVVPAPSGNLVVTSVTRNLSGDVVINFTGAAATAYKVTKSANLTTAFGPLTVPLTATTDAGGAGQAVVPASEASERAEFYRIEDQ